MPASPEFAPPYCVAGAWFDRRQAAERPRNGSVAPRAAIPDPTAIPPSAETGNVRFRLGAFASRHPSRMRDYLHRLR